jgi:predicted type IV restriction endonuclease
MLREYQANHQPTPERTLITGLRFFAWNKIRTYGIAPESTATLKELRILSMSATLRDEDIETEARTLIRERIQNSGWYPSLHGNERRRRIEEDVDRHWHLMIKEAARRLAEGLAQDTSG